MNNYRRLLSRVSSLALVFLLSACVQQEADSPIEVTWADPVAGPLLVQNVAVFDSRSGLLLRGQDVLVRDAVITAVGPSGSLRNTQSARVISGQGATLIPGLFDMHGHVMATTGPTWETASPNPDDNLRAYAFAGVTTVFDPGDSSDEAFSRRQRVADGELLGPRIFTAGRIITDPKGHPRSVVDALAPWWIAWLLKPQVATGVATPEEARAAVDQRADDGADAVKVAIDSIPLDAEIMPRAVLLAVVDQASQRKLRTVAHIGTTEDAIATGDSGVALWVHGVYKERVPQKMIAKLAGYGIPMVTTSEVFDRYGRALQGPLVPTTLERQMLSADKIASFFPPPDGFDLGGLQSWVELMQQTREVRLDNVRRLHAAGVTILAGSDTQSGVFPGAGLHRELATLVDAGLSPAEAIRAATLDAARFLAGSAEPDAGLIAVGKRADLVLVNGDPTQNIAAVSDIREVILNGKLLERRGVQ